MRTDVYQKITAQIVAALEQGVRPWHQPWKAEHSAGRIARPLRGNGIPYQGINVLMLGWKRAWRLGGDLAANVRKRSKLSIRKV